MLNSIRHYKDDGYEVNKKLRFKKPLTDSEARHVKHLDRATSFKTTKPMHVYRGVPDHAFDVHSMKPDTEFTDHGFSSTSMDHATAKSFAGHSGSRRHIFKIHLPEGTKAHHFDAHASDSDHEHEVVLHRGTRFRVSHHSYDKAANVHYIHAHVVHQQDHLKESLDENIGDEKHPHDKMRDYTPKELDWEYHTEYEKYSKPHFPKAFKSREHFQKRYDESPTRHLTDDEHENLDNYSGDHRDMDEVRRNMGHRRDVDRIAHDLKHGKTAPPIVLRHKNGMHLMAGNTRLSVASAHKKRLPVKVIDV
jgi:hypothetical protein